MKNYFFILIILIIMVLGCTKSGSANNGGNGGNTTVPAPIAQTVTNVAISANSFVATWQPVTNATSYLLYVAADTLFTQPLTNFNPFTTSSTTDTVSNLSANTKYYFRVKAQVGNTISDFSNIVSTSTLAVKTSQWKAVGSVGLSYGAVVCNTALAFDNSNIPYIAFQDKSYSGSAVVMKFTGTVWSSVGTPGFTAPKIGLVSLAIDKSANVPYLLYTDAYDGNSGGYATVKKYNGTSWVTVGNAQFAKIVDQSSSIAIDKNGTPYVAIIDWSNNLLGKASVMKFNGSSWVYVGQAGFSTNNLLGFISLVLDGNGVPYVSYDDGYGTNVQKFNGSSWVIVGASRFNGQGANMASLSIDKNNTLYIDYSTANGYEWPACSKFDGANWNKIGSITPPGPFSTDGYFYPAFAVSGSGIPYTAFQHNTSIFHSASCMAYINNSWAFAGNTSFTGGYIGVSRVNTSNVGIFSPALALAIDNNNIPFVAYADNTISGRATVMKLTP